MGNKGKILLNVVLALIAGVLIYQCWRFGDSLNWTIFPISCITVLGIALGVYGAISEESNKSFITITVIFVSALALAAITLALPGTNPELFNIGLGFFTSGLCFSLLLWTKFLKKGRKVEGEHANQNP